jgi:hypothetical protein
MAALLRVLVATALAIALALPGVSDEGGENSGGLGVWVLPRASFVPPIPATPRDTRSAHSISQDCVMQLSSECGAAAGTFVEDMAGVPVALQVTGSTVRIPAALLQAMALHPSATATVIVTDSQQLGYVVRIAMNGNGTATIRVF